jgi:hypothetical protein
MIKTLTSEDGKLRFEFDTTRWTLIKAYDILHDVQKFSDSKVDFIGLLDNDKLVLIEVKNFRNRPYTASDNLVKKLQPDDQSKHDPKNQPVIKEVVDSVKDSLLFMALSPRYTVADTALWTQFQQLLIESKTKIFTIFCLETDADYLPKVDAKKLAVYKGLMMKRLKASLYNLCTDVFIVDSSNHMMPPALSIHYVI